MTTEVEEKKVTTRTRKKAVDLPLSDAEKRQLEASVEKAKEDIIHQRTAKDARLEQYSTDRYRCKITGTATRKGEKVVEMVYEDPTNPDRPVKMAARLGEWIEEGLPLHAIKRIMAAYDVGSSERVIGDGESAGRTHEVFKTPRYVVEWDPTKPIKKAE